MRKSPVCRLAAALLFFVWLLGSTPVLAVHASKNAERRALSNVLIPIEDGLDRIEPDDTAFRLFSDETVNPYEQIHADFAWGYETYGNEVNVAVLDTGCIQHPALTDTLKKNYYFKDVTDEDGNLVDYELVETDESTDTHGHGTHVAGIIAAQLGNALQVKGIAPKVNLYAFNCSVKTANGSTVINLGMALTAMEYAVHTLGCKVINMSFGTPESNLTANTLNLIHDYIQDAYQAGTILVASVGNDYDATRNYPATFDEVIGVGSVNSKNVRSSFSNTNNTVDVVAPGGDVKKDTVTGSTNESIYSLGLNTAYTTSKCGTSQAAPHVAGAAALMLAVKPSLTPAEFKVLLQNCSAKIHGEGYDATDGYGNGLLDVRSMFGALTDGQSCYIAPPSDDHIALFNLTDLELVAQTACTAFTDSGILKSCHIEDVTIEAHNVNRLPYAKTETAQRLFLWKLTTLTPLAAARQMN